MKNTFLLIIITVLSISMQVRAEKIETTPFSFICIDGKMGLSQSNVKSIVQDSWGFMWLGTRNGLNRYDGVSVKRYNCVDLILRKGNNNISALFEDPDHYLWVGTDMGVYIFNPITEQFSYLGLKSRDGVQMTSWVSQIQSDKKGNIWIIVPGQGAFRYNIQKKRLYHYYINHNKDHSKDGPERMCIRQSGDVWVSSNGAGIYHYDEKRDSFKQFITDKNNHSLKDDDLYAICDYGKWLVLGAHNGKLRKYNPFTNILEDVNAPNVHYKIIRDVLNDHGELWIATQNGLYIVNESKGEEVHLTENAFFPNALSDKFIYSIYKDREDGIWLGTMYGGVNYLPKPSFNFRKYVPLGNPSSLSSKRIREMAQTTDGNIYIGTDDGLNVFNPRTQEFHVVDYKNAKLTNRLNVYGLMADGNDLWVGYFKNGLDIISAKGGMRHFSAADMGLNEASVYALCKDHTGKVWLGNAWGVFVAEKGSDKFKLISRFGYNYVYDIKEDSKGRIWVATMAGVFRYNPRTQQLKHYVNIPLDKQSLSSNSVSSITEDSRGVLWFSTDRGGICHYNDRKDNFTTYSINEGLPDDVAYKILEDKYHNLWFGTNMGLVMFNPDTKKVQVFKKNDGLLGNQFNYKSALKSREGIFYFGGIDGLIAFNPYQTKQKVIPPIVYITKLCVNNKEVNPSDSTSILKESILHTNKILLKYDQSNINFDFSSLNFSEPELSHYAYMMDGFDNGWIYTNNNKNISYSNLPPGKYTFYVKTINEGGVWSKSTVLQVQILPPWWLSKIAYIVYIALAFGLLFYWIRWRRRYEKQEAFEKQHLFEAQKEKELYSVKVDFFTNIAHEVRTPLTLINGPLETILEMDIKNDVLSKNLHTIELNTKRLLDLINQLLDFRKVDEKKFSLNYGMVNINNLLTEIVSRFESTILIQHKKISLEMPDESIIISADKEAITKIVSNLLNNAMKYSEKFIKILLFKEQSTLTLKIINDGKHIPTKDAANIFKPFFRLPKTGEGQVGSGIGLPLARSLAELHKGELYFDLQSTDNTFVLVLPLYQEGSVPFYHSKLSMQEEVIEENNQLSHQKNYTILVVDDNMEMLDFISDKLSSYYAIITATNGQEALNSIKENGADLVITDLMMPVMDGLELCHEIKSEVSYRHIPVILLTAKNDLDSKIKGLEMGVDAYIEKPFSFKYLLTQINTLFSNREKEYESFSEKPFFPIHCMKMNKADEELLNNMICLVQENITNENFNVEYLADLLCMSRSSLLRKIKVLTNQSPIDFIKLIRLRKAAELIIDGKYRINEIGFMVGISSPSYFSKIFQKQFGVSPKDFTKQNSNIND